MPDMRFAPPNRLRIADRASGLNQISVGSYNERLVLSLLLQGQGMSRMEIGKQTGLSAQTISVIVRSLEQEGLVAKGEARRGRVGPPTIPLSLNPEGAFSVGVSIGYRTIDVVLIDFVGSIRYHKSLTNSAPGQFDVHGHCIESIKEAIDRLPVKLRTRITGTGLALPQDIDTWELDEEIPGESVRIVQNDIENLLELPVFVQNDITAAAGGESMFGVAKTMSDYLFFFLGAKLHSRLILNHQIHNGNRSVSIPSDTGILSLERMLQKQDIETEDLWDHTTEWPDYDETTLDTWKQECQDSLQNQVEALAQFVNLKTVVLSSYASSRLTEEICQDLSDKIEDIEFTSGIIPTAPKAIGAASLPFISRFMVSNIR